MEGIFFILHPRGKDDIQRLKKINKTSDFSIVFQKRWEILYLSTS